jgi:Na+/H+ antiporter NhaC
VIHAGFFYHRRETRLEMCLRIGVHLLRQTPYVAIFFHFVTLCTFIAGGLSVSDAVGIIPNNGVKNGIFRYREERTAFAGDYNSWQ